MTDDLIKFRLQLFGAKIVIKKSKQSMLHVRKSKSNILQSNSGFSRIHQVVDPFTQKLPQKTPLSLPPRLDPCARQNSFDLSAWYMVVSVRIAYATENHFFFCPSAKSNFKYTISAMYYPLWEQRKISIKVHVFGLANIYRFGWVEQSMGP